MTTSKRILLPLFHFLVMGGIALGQPGIPSETTPAQKHLSDALEAAQKNNRQKAVSAFKEFLKVKEDFDFSDQQDILLFRMAAPLFCVTKSDAERDEFYRRSIEIAKNITQDARKDTVLKILAATMARCGANGETLIEMSELCTHPEATARLLVLAVLADSKTLSIPKWEDFVPSVPASSKNIPQRRQRSRYVSGRSPQSQSTAQSQPEDPEPDIKATTVAMGRILDHITSSCKDVDPRFFRPLHSSLDPQFDRALQVALAMQFFLDRPSVIIEHLGQSFKNEPFKQLFLEAIKSCKSLDSRVKRRAVLQLENNAAFLEERQKQHKQLEKINEKIIEAIEVAKLDILNPREIDQRSPEFQNSQKILVDAAKQAKLLGVNDSRSAALFSIAQIQVMLGDMENAKDALLATSLVETHINTNDLVLGQIIDLQKKAGESDLVVGLTANKLYSLSESSDQSRGEIASRLLAKSPDQLSQDFRRLMLNPNVQLHQELAKHLRSKYSARLHLVIAGDLKCEPSDLAHQGVVLRSIEKFSDQATLCWMPEASRAALDRHLDAVAAPKIIIEDGIETMIEKMIEKIGDKIIRDELELKLEKWRAEKKSDVLHRPMSP